MSDNTSITVTRKRGFTLVYNDLLPADGTLSARAWGIYVYLVGRPDGWECRTGQLRTVFSEGRDALYTALRELVTAGLMHKVEYTEDGLRRTRYQIDADPQTPRSTPETGFQDPGHQDPGDPGSGSPDPENPGQVSKDPPTEEATTEGTRTAAPAAVAVDLNAGRDDVDRLCQHLSDRLTQRGVKHLASNGSIYKAWRDAARLMIDADGRTEAQVHNMIEWANRHAFWGPNILSMPKLREKYDQMRQRALAETKGGAPSNRHTVTDSPLARDDAWEAQ